MSNTRGGALPIDGDDNSIRRRSSVSSKQENQVLGNDSKGTDSKKAASANRPTKAPKGLDRWFDEELNKLYVDVVNEPLPDDLARLITELKARKAT